jgi:pilus assembly protein CpaF
MLQALNTGHSGAGATIHANSIKDVPARINAIGRGAGVGAADLAEMCHSAIKWVIHLAERKIVALGTLSLSEAGRLEVVPHEI